MLVVKARSTVVVALVVFAVQGFSDALADQRTQRVASQGARDVLLERGAGRQGQVGEER